MKFYIKIKSVVYKIYKYSHFKFSLILVYVYVYVCVYCDSQFANRANTHNSELRAAHCSL